MKVILMQDVKALGSRGAVVSVSDGYAMNFLFPQNLAVQATEQSIQRMRDAEAKATKVAKKGEGEARKLAAALDGFELLLKEKVSDGGVLYAAVTPKIVASALKKAGYAVGEDAVEMPPIKEPGEREIVVNLPHGFEASVKVIVEAK
ncbi:50S ribosomal protein L9 [bacterium]|nr:50S ribosomal protein L9 [bacterium]